MRKILAALLLSVILFACSKDDDKGGEGYLTSIDKVKTGISGLWESTTGGKSFTSYDVNGNTCTGTNINNWYACTKYDISKKEPDYIIRIYDIGGTINDYTDWKIVVLNDSKLTMRELGRENREITNNRVTQ